MGLFDFIKDVGKTLGITDDEQVSTDELIAEIKKNNLEVKDLVVSVDGEKVSVSGLTESQEIREKVILTLGNVKGVSQLEDNIEVEKTEEESVFYTVVRGDTLSGIAKKQYGKASKYMVIFEANKPMLKDPDKIYPGQALRIPKI